jgi:hypothetical protein
MFWLPQCMTILWNRELMISIAACVGEKVLGSRLGWAERFTVAVGVARTQHYI